PYIGSRASRPSTQYSTTPLRICAPTSAVMHHKLACVTRQHNGPPVSVPATAGNASTVHDDTSHLDGETIGAHLTEEAHAHVGSADFSRHHRAELDSADVADRLYRGGGETRVV